MSGRMSMVGTAIAVSSSMIGTVLLVLPQVFLQYGLLTCLIIVIPVSVILAYTCSLWAKHLREDDPDIADVVLRVLGSKMSVAFRCSSGLALFLLTCVVYLLISDLTYEMLVSLFGKGRHNLVRLNVGFQYHPDTTGVDFNRFSVQYLGLGLLVPLGWLVSLRSIHVVLKFSKLAMLCLLAYFALIVTFFVENLQQHRVQNLPPKLWSSNISELISAVSILSFAVVAHPSISPILKENENYQDGQKSVFLGFGITTLLYIVFGVLGQFGLMGRQKVDGTSILDYFKGQWLEPAIGIPSIIYLLSIFPIYPYVSRRQLLSERMLENRYIYYCYSLVLVCIMALFQVNNLDPKLLISFIGAVMCWLVCYLLPVVIDYKERRRRAATEAGSLLGSSSHSLEGAVYPEKPIKDLLKDIAGIAILAIGTTIMFGELYSLFAK